MSSQRLVNCLQAQGSWKGWEGLREFRGLLRRGFCSLEFSAFPSSTGIGAARSSSTETTHPDLGIRQGKADAEPIQQHRTINPPQSFQEPGHSGLELFFPTHIVNTMTSAHPHTCGPHPARSFTPLPRNIPLPLLWTSRVINLPPWGTFSLNLQR